MPIKQDIRRDIPLVGIDRRLKIGEPGYEAVVAAVSVDRYFAERLRIAIEAIITQAIQQRVQRQVGLIRQTRIQAIVISHEFHPHAARAGIDFRRGIAAISADQLRRAGNRGGCHVIRDQIADLLNC